MTASVKKSSVYFPDKLSVTDAQERILATLKDIPLKTEWIPLMEGLNRILSVDIASPSSVPEFDSAAMDGFAFSSEKNDLKTELTLDVIGYAYAGHPYQGIVSERQCVQIMTGAVVPKDCDTVVQQENIQQLDDGKICIPAATSDQGDNIRKAGENLSKGQHVLSAGTRLKPQDLGLLASLGIAQISVFKKITVAVFSTGDELCPLGMPLSAGKIYDTNRIILLNMLKELGCKTIDMGILEDHPDTLEHALKETASKADVILTSGGVSVGSADYTKQAISRLGNIDFWSIKMRPGRPMAFGIINSESNRTLIFGLPGNPVAAMISFLFFVRPALLTMMGMKFEQPKVIQAVSTMDIKKKNGRTEFQRGIIQEQDNGLTVSLTGNQGSGIIQSMSKANCIIQLNENRGNVKIGDPVDVILLDSLR